jgi:hypothetical protein
MKRFLMAALCCGVGLTFGPELAGGKFPSFGIIPGHLGGEAFYGMAAACRDKTIFFNGNPCYTIRPIGFSVIESITQ